MKTISEGRIKTTLKAGVMLLLGCLPACASISGAEQVRARAGGDLRCDTADVQATQVDDNTVSVRACGQERTYVRECIVKQDTVPTEAGFSAETTHCDWVAQGLLSTASHAGSTAQ
jgi:hypothetical protein